MRLGYTDAEGDQITDGDDVIVAGAGNDTVSAALGDDRITLGDGDDLLELSRLGGADTLSDFDISDDDVNGFFNDQLNVSDLQGGSGQAARCGPLMLW